MELIYRFLGVMALAGLLPTRATCQVSLICEADSVFNELLGYGTMIDQDGNSCKTIVIGSQEWMAGNLSVSKYRNGSPILHLPNDSWTTTNAGAWCWYNNDSASHHCPYGKLYNWYAVQDSRKLCPTGWHVPTEQEWVQLENFLEGSDFAGGKMKSIGLQYWTGSNTGASNVSGFSALPGGFRYGVTGVAPFEAKGNVGYLWSASASPNVQGTAFFRGLSHDSPSLITTNFIYRSGMSVRCVNDQPVTGVNRSFPSTTISISPNPAHSYFRVSVPDGLGVLPYVLLSLEGKVISAGSLVPGDACVPLLGIPKGLYFFRLGMFGNAPMKVLVE